MRWSFLWLPGSRQAGVALAALLAGCASPAQQQVQKEDMLAAAGFRWRSADSPDWQTAVTGLPPHRFTHRTVNGQTIYYYADPNVCRCVYYGTAQNWAAYRRMMSAQRIATEREVDAYLDQAATKGSGGD